MKSPARQAYRLSDHHTEETAVDSGPFRVNEARNRACIPGPVIDVETHARIQEVTIK